MKRFKLPAFVLALGLVVLSAFAFNTTSVKTDKLYDTYYYVGDNTIGEMRLPANWLNSGTSCGETGDYPCTINFSDGDRAAFDAHVANFPNVATATSEAATKRN